MEFGLALHLFCLQDLLDHLHVLTSASAVPAAGLLSVTAPLAVATLFRLVCLRIPMARRRDPRPSSNSKNGGFVVVGTRTAAPLPGDGEQHQWASRAPEGKARGARGTAWPWRWSGLRSSLVPRESVACSRCPDPWTQVIRVLPE